MPKKKPTCLEPDCSEPAHTRGLCSAHYQAWSRDIRNLPESKKAECEREAIAAGLILPKQKSGPKPKLQGELQKLIFKYKQSEIQPEPSQDKRNSKHSKAAEKKPGYRNRKKKNS